MAQLLDGRALAADLRQELANKVRGLTTIPRLGVVLVGDDPASHLYVKLKQQAATEVGIAVATVVLPATATQAEVESAIQQFNQRSDVHGILVQFPLPATLNEHAAIAALDPAKDADGFHPQNLERFLRGEAAVTPGVSEGIVRLIDAARQALKGKQAALVVNSQEFARPLKKLLEDRGAQVTIAHAPSAALQQADVIVVALGQPGSLTGEYLKDGAVVIDVGTTKVGNRLLGDVDAGSLAGRRVFLTPVPGGVGPMTVAMLLWNVYRLAVQRPR